MQSAPVRWSARCPSWGAGYGKVRMLKRGCFALALDNAGRPVIVRMMQTRTLRGRFERGGSGSVWTLCVPPAMAAGVTGRLWEIADIVKVLEDREATN